MNFIKSLYKGGMLFDGGFGAMLMALGVQSSDCSELMNLEAPDVVRRIHRSFIDAGSNAVESNTFGANPMYLGKYGLSDRSAAITAAGVSLAKEAAGAGGFAVLSMGPSGGMLMPMGSLSAGEMLEGFYTQAKAGIDAGADAVIIETMGDISEARLAAIAAIRARGEKDVPVIASFTFEGERLMTGGAPDCAALILQAVGVDALGINCSGGPAELVSVLKKMRAAASLPIIVQPNAGVPHMEKGRTVFPLSPEDMAKKMEVLVAAGAQAIGGCCGTTPEHIALLRPLADEIGSFVPEGEDIKAAVTQRKIFPMSDIRGEFQTIPATVDDLYDADPDAAAVRIDISGLGREQTEELMLEAQQVLKAPLCLDSDDPRMLEFALSIYGGVALTHGKSSYGAVSI
ncbi:MAG: homocysteine S-methyltransferase family protein [Christensenellales bacterium]|jgi:5-methyltetrahydrofolate--homocysteine methyltransferase